MVGLQGLEKETEEIMKSISIALLAGIFLACSAPEDEIIIKRYLWDSGSLKVTATYSSWTKGKSIVLYDHSIRPEDIFHTDVDSIVAVADSVARKYAELLKVKKIRHE